MFTSGTNKCKQSEYQTVNPLLHHILCLNLYIQFVHLTIIFKRCKIFFKLKRKTLQVRFFDSTIKLMHFNSTRNLINNFVKKIK